MPGPGAKARVCGSGLSGEGPAQAGGLMTVTEYFISGLLYIFQNQMECHFFFQERWGTSLSSFPIQTTYSLASEINGTGSFQGREREKQDPSSLPPLPASLAHIAASLITQYSNPLSPGQLQQSTGERPFPDPCVYTEIESQGHLIHPSTAKNQSTRHGNFSQIPSCS